MPTANIHQTIGAIRSGDRLALARAITVVENDLPGATELLHSLQHTAAARTVGITGPPGAGKSTLVNALLAHWLAAGKTVAVLAVDPSSPFNYGALLGDRIRMSRYYDHPQVFIRSLASRGALGGLHPRILEITDLMKSAGFDLVVVETVGVGQSEVEIAGLADCTVVTLVPEGGDIVQTMKAGIMEIADIFVVNKADREASEALYRNLRLLAHERAGDGAETEVLKTVASEGKGIAGLGASIDRFLEEQQGLPPRRLHLLAQKAWQIIQQRRMSDIDRQQLADALQKAVSDPAFNIYSFTDAFLQHGPGRSHP